MNLLNFQLVTPEKTVLQQELTSLSCPTTQGQITILPEHTALVATLVPGEIHAKSATDDFYINVTGGFVEVKPGSNVIVLADAAEHHFEIDLQRAEEAKKRAQAALSQAKGSEDYALVAASLEKSLARINVAKKHAHRKNPLTGQGTLTE